MTTAVVERRKLKSWCADWERLRFKALGDEVEPLVNHEITFTSLAGGCDRLGDEPGVLRRGELAARASRYPANDAPGG